MSDLLSTTAKKRQNLDSTYKVSPFQPRSFGVQQKAAESAPATKAELWENYQQAKQLSQKGVNVSAPALPIQAKLTIGQPGDKYEQEADSMAAQVMQMPEPGLANSNITNSVQTRSSIQPIQRVCSECQEEKKEESKPEDEGEQIQAKEEAGQTPEISTTSAKITELPIEPSIQRDSPSSLPNVPNYQLTPPSLLAPADPSSRYKLGGDLTLHLDPEMQAAMQQVQEQVNPTIVRTALSQIKLTLPSADRSTPATTNPLITPAPPAPTATPLVPAGAGPDKPRAASGSDIMDGVLGLPVVDTAVESIKTQASDRFTRDWHRLNTGEKFLAISSVVTIAGGALAGIIADPAARKLALDQLNGKVLPVPGLNWLHLEINTGGDNLMLGLHLDVGRLLPSGLGFKGSSPSAIGGPPETQPLPIQRKLDSAGDPESGSNLESQLNGSKGGGSPLTDEVRSFMEPRFGADFGGVRVHTGSDAVQMNGQLNAQAFAHGSDIYFGAGKSPGNNELTAHELTHVVQQTGANILQQKLNDDGTQRVSQHQSLCVQRSPALGFQKQPIIEALNKKPDPDYAEAYKLLNVLAMFDMLSTLNALKRSGQFDQLNSNLGKAVGVNTPRLQIAFFAVQAKADNKTEDFMLRHGRELTTLPQDQRIDILNFIDAKWVDELKLADDENALIAQIRANAVFQALAPDDKNRAEEIIAESQKRRMKSFHSSVYCLEKLKLLFETPEKDPQEQSAATQASTDTEVTKEKSRLAKPAAVKRLGLEEKVSKKSSKKMIPIKGADGGGTYYLDNSDPTHIVVKAKVFLRVTTNGDAKNIANSKKSIPSIKKMEDAIEKAASNKGYLVDIVFVKAPDPDTFTAEVDPSKWETSGNWSGGDPAGFAHELHHLIAFPIDRYDYIKSHAGNKGMKIPDRLEWFREELNKADDYNDPTSIMGKNNSQPNDRDVCTVAQLDVATCTAARQAALSKKK